MYIVVAIIIFGLLIGMHEFGHFITAKAFHVRVNEFSVGMGPAIIKKQRGETLYALRVCPFGGYCAMEGENDDTGDERAFSRKKTIVRLAILAAGPFTNFLFGLIVMLVLCTQFIAFGSNTVYEFADGFPLVGQNGLMAGDKIVSIDGHGVYYAEDFSMYMDRAGGKSVDMTVVRDGKRVKLRDLPLARDTYKNDDGTESERYGVTFGYIEATPFERVKFSFYKTCNFVRLVFMGLSDIITGAVGLREMSGAVGIVDTISETGKSAPNIRAAAISIAYICSFLAVNLAVMNLLPIPALDGGRMFLAIVVWAIQKVFRIKVNPKYEGLIHTVGMLLLLALMAVLVINDVVRIIGR